MLELKKWPEPGAAELRELYEHVNQKYCLVQLPLPLPEEQTKNYLNAVHTGISGDRLLLTRGIFLDGILIGKAELNRYPDMDAELDIVIRNEYTGKRYGLEALAMLLEEVTALQWCTSVSAYVHRDNMHARKLMMKAGLRQGRTFQADILVPDHGNYRLKTVSGYEYHLDIQEVKR
ncbi:MAG: GNAT family N-acetyltransferase [Solobacterium sp.]|nr:GNAT family N-acetyltransferase [Solobacterium sp.]